MEKLNEFFFDYGMKILAAILVIVVGSYLVRLVMRMVEKALAKSSVDISLHTFIKTVVRLLMQIVVLLTAAGVLDIPSTTFITILGSAGLAIGLALKDSLGNFAGGILLLSFRPFKVGDYIESDGVGGTVKDIHILYTHLNTPDNRRVMIPNGILANARITNYSTEDRRRLELIFGVAYGSDIEKVKAAINEVIASNPMVIMDPEPIVRMQAHRESAVEITVKVWCLKENYWNLHYDMHEQVKASFDRNGISIPYPTRSIRVVKDTAESETIG